MNEFSDSSLSFVVLKLQQICLGRSWLAIHYLSLFWHASSFLLLNLITTIWEILVLWLSFRFYNANKMYIQSVLIFECECIFFRASCTWFLNRQPFPIRLIRISLTFLPPVTTNFCIIYSLVDDQLFNPPSKVLTLWYPSCWRRSVAMPDLFPAEQIVTTFLFLLSLDIRSSAFGIDLMEYFYFLQYSSC